MTNDHLLEQSLIHSYLSKWVNIQTIFWAIQMPVGKRVVYITEGIDSEDSWMNKKSIRGPLRPSGTGNAAVMRNWPEEFNIVQKTSKHAPVLNLDCYNGRISNKLFKKSWYGESLLTDNVELSFLLSFFLHRGSFSADIKKAQSKISDCAFGCFLVVDIWQQSHLTRTLNSFG